MNLFRIKGKPLYQDIGRLKTYSRIPSRWVQVLTGVEAPKVDVAVIGSGPGGCYVVQRLLKDSIKLKNENQFQNIKIRNIDIYEQNPTPYGLVRYGVAPDHQEVKNVADVFNMELFDFNQTKSEDKNEDKMIPKIRFLGNLGLERDFKIQDLIKKYSIDDLLLIVFCLGPKIDNGFGNDNIDKAHGVVRNYLSARDFVEWYNQLPSRTTDEQEQNKNQLIKHDANIHLPSLKEALKNNKNQGLSCVVLGQGNVALDIARILLFNENHFEKTDIADYALNFLHKDHKKTIFNKVSLVGRRGPIQMSFSTKELREIFKLVQSNNIKLKIDKKYVLDEIERYKSIITKSRLLKRKMDLFKQMVESELNIDNDNNNNIENKILEFRFLESPSKLLIHNENNEEIEFNYNNNNNENSSRIIGLKLQENELNYENSKLFDNEINNEEKLKYLTNVRSNLNSKKEIINLKCDLLIQSIGYKCSSINENIILNDNQNYKLPYDSKKGIIPNIGGLIKLQSNDNDIYNNNENFEPKAFVAGWLKTGCKGKIVDTMQSSYETADNLIEQINLKFNSKENIKNFNNVKDIELKNKDTLIINNENWKTLNEYEIKKGSSIKIRSKLESFNEDYIKQILS